MSFKPRFPNYIICIYSSCALKHISDIKSYQESMLLFLLIDLFLSDSSLAYINEKAIVNVSSSFWRLRLSNEKAIWNIFRKKRVRIE